MMRKLAVTVFAISLTLIGCGSSSTSKKDASGDTSTAPDVAKDTLVSTPDTYKAPDTGVIDTKLPDTALAEDTAPKTDVLGDTTPADTRDGSLPDKAGDTVKLDTNPDTKIVIPDAPADTNPVIGDASLEVGGDAQVD